MGKVIFYDTVELKPVSDKKPEAKDFYVGANGAKTLRIRVAATHSGRITRNNGFYLPHKMRAGADTFTTPFPKPILTHHDAHGEPIGRVVSAKYVDISQGIAPGTDAIKDAVQDRSWIDQLNSGKLSKAEVIAILDKYFVCDGGLAEDPNFPGMGYIELIADISDPDAIQKITDGRYLTGSTGATTDSAICNICQKDWAEDGRCEHEPGQKYEGKKCALVAGNLAYDEYSMVNKPADPDSKIIQINVQGLADSIQSKDQIIDSTTITIVVPEELKMTFKEAFAVATGTDKYKVIPKLEDLVKGLVDKEQDLTGDSLVKFLDEEIAKITPPEPPKPVEQPKDAKSILGDTYDEIVGDDEWGKEYAQMIADCISGELKGEDGESLAAIADKKLTAAARKALPSSTFCKPPKGYPVNDCNHAKSAMAYAKKNNEAASVVACIRRKAARLGCPFKDEQQEQKLDETQVGIFVLDYFDTFSNEELAQLMLGLQNAIKERKLDCGCDSLANAAKTKELEALFAAKTDELSKSVETQTADLQAKLDSCRKENKYLAQDIDNLNDSLASAVKAVKDVTLRHIEDLSKLGKVEFKLDDYTTRTQKEVTAVLDELSHKVDIAKIVDNLNSGLSNTTPTGAVENPLLIQDNSTNDKTIDETLIDEHARNQAFYLRVHYGDAAADKYLQDYVAAKKSAQSAQDSVKE